MQHNFLYWKYNGTIQLFWILNAKPNIHNNFDIDLPASFTEKKNRFMNRFDIKDMWGKKDNLRKQKYKAAVEHFLSFSPPCKRI